MTCYFCFLALQILSLFSLVVFITIQEQRLPRKKPSSTFKVGFAASCTLCSKYWREVLCCTTTDTPAPPYFNSMWQTWGTCSKYVVLFYVQLITTAKYSWHKVQKSTYNMLTLWSARWCMNSFYCFHQNSNPLQFDLLMQHFSNFPRSYLFFPPTLQLQARFLFPSC